MATIATMTTRGLTLSADQVVDKMCDSLTHDLTPHLGTSYQHLAVSPHVRKATVRRLRKRWLLHYGTLPQRALVPAEVQRERVWASGLPEKAGIRVLGPPNEACIWVPRGPKKEHPEGGTFEPETVPVFGVRK